ncbi:hypothetical protein AAC387_Pa06g1268 [Persea americana]
MVSPASLCSLATICLVSFLLLFSIFSLSFIFHFRLKTLHSHSHHLRDFNSLWPLRILLVSFASLWSLTELLRLPLHDPIFLLLPTPLKRETLCKLYVVSSLGLFQPCFFITLLFLLSISLNKETNYENSLSRALFVIFLFCIPAFLSQLFFVFFSGAAVWRSPEVFMRQFIIIKQGKVVQCTHPLIGTGILGVFSSLYVVCFAGVCWRAVLMVINKKLRIRIYGLAFAVVLSLSVQFLSLALSVIWRPGDLAFEALSLVAFLSVLSCALVGEGILVIQPLADALIVEGFSSRRPSVSC